jgi:hypothetical protein
MPLISEANQSGCESLRQIANWLNKRYVRSARGAKFNPTTVKRVLAVQAQLESQ